MTLAPGQHALWPTPIGVHRHPSAPDLNALLVRVFGAMRATQALRAESTESTGSAGSDRGADRAEQVGRTGLIEPTRAAFFASDDDLVSRIRLPEWQGFVGFLVECLRDTAKAANAGAWPEAGLDLRVDIEGLWFQISNRGAFHDVHTHGNCSWSGVYVVQADAAALRVAHPVHGALNGVTRFYGPSFAHLAGAHVDVGNAYLQPPHLDVAPEPGQLIVFPSWLAHRALPYEGAADRIVVSFNASLHAARGSDRRHGYAAA